MTYDFLSPISDDGLRAYLRRQLPKEARGAVVGLPRARLLSALFSAHGHALLHERSARLLLFSSLDVATLEAIATEAACDIRGKPYDTAVGLASLAWRPGSKVVGAVAEHLSLDAEYLPSTADRQSAIEKVDPFSPAPTLFDFQAEIVDLVLKAMGARDAPACLVQLPTGSGKTRTAMEIVSALFLEAEQSSFLVVWLAHTEELCEQAVGTFTQVWSTRGDRQLRVARAWGDFHPAVADIGSGLLVTSFQKASSLRSRDPGWVRIF